MTCFGDDVYNRRISIMNKLNQKISEIGVVPVIKLNHPERDAAPLAKALCEGGVPVAEVTFRAAGAPLAIKAMKETCPDMIVGAGTVTTTAHLNHIHMSAFWSSVLGLVFLLMVRVYSPLRRRLSMKLKSLSMVAFPSFLIIVASITIRTVNHHLESLMVMERSKNYSVNYYPVNHS